MKKRVFVLLGIMMLCTYLIGCGESKAALDEEIVSLKTEIKQLEEQKESLKTEIVDTKVKNGTAKYIITFNIKQSHFTFDIAEHIKDEMNDISIQVPVDKEYYDSVEIGDEIDDSFRMGSLIMKGSFGSWKVTVEDKKVE